MPDIKLKNASGVEQVYTGVDTITVPLADGTGSWVFGPTDEELTFSGARYLITGHNERLMERFLPRIKIKPYLYQNASYMYCDNLTFRASNLTDLSSIVIDCADVQYFSGANMIDSCPKLSKLPQVINSEHVALTAGAIISNSADNVFEDEFLKFLQCFNKTTNNSPTGSNSGCACLPLSTNTYQWLDLSEVFAQYHALLNHPESYAKYSSNPSYNGLSACQYCKSIRNIPIQYIDTTARTSSFTILPSYALGLTDSFTFALNAEGQPCVMPWKSMVLDLSHGSYTIGYNGVQGYSYMGNNPNYAQGYWKPKNNIFTSDKMTIAQAQERYNELKGQEDWYAMTNNNATYNNSTIKLARLFSRYNHDSMVETINSLPDTSAYLATAGGTNTIKFSKYCGALTDAGGPEQLTDAEIAVATAKGWTVTIV